MARKAQLPGSAKKEKKYPSPFGSHASMVDEQLTNRLGDERLAVLRDDKGLYVTFSERLDNGEADPNRYASKEAREDVRPWISTIEMFRNVANGMTPGAAFFGAVESV